MKLFRRHPKPTPCRTVLMRWSSTGYRPWPCTGTEGDGHHCIAFYEGRPVMRGGDLDGQHAGHAGQAGETP